MNKRLKKTLQYLFFLGLGIFLVWWSIKDLTTADKSLINSSLANARYWLIIPVFLILLASHLIRALRWKLLIEPMGYAPAVKNTFFTVMVGYLANQAVPRLGEVLKCTLLSRYEKIPVEKLIGTVILERIIDALTLLIIFFITIVIQPEIYNLLIQTFFNSKSADVDKPVSGMMVLLAVFALVALFIGLWMLIKKKSVKDLKSVIYKVVKSFWQGIISIRHLKKRSHFLALTVILWTLYLLGGYIGFLAFRETAGYGLKEAFTVLSAGSIGMIATPGGIGAYAYLIQKSMQIYGLNEGIALAFGWILWLVTTAVILIGGLISFVLLPVYNKNR